MSSPCEDLQECRQNETGVENPANKRADAYATPTLRNHCSSPDGPFGPPGGHSGIIGDPQCNQYSFHIIDPLTRVPIIAALSVNQVLAPRFLRAICTSNLAEHFEKERPTMVRSKCVLRLLAILIAGVHAGAQQITG